MTGPVSKYRAAYELMLSTVNARELINEANRWMISQREDLIRRLKEDSISKEELDETMAEINLVEQRVKALYEQIKKSEKTVGKIFGKDENKG